jgi:hypothetical protein
MTVYPYQIQVVRPDGERSIVVYYAVSTTNAHYIARELHPGCQISVIGLEPEWGTAS